MICREEEKGVRCECRCARANKSIPWRNFHERASLKRRMKRHSTKTIIAGFWRSLPSFVDRELAFSLSDLHPEVLMNLASSGCLQWLGQVRQPFLTLKTRCLWLKVGHYHSRRLVSLALLRPSTYLLSRSLGPLRCSGARCNRGNNRRRAEDWSPWKVS